MKKLVLLSLTLALSLQTNAQIFKKYEESADTLEYTTYLSNNYRDNVAVGISGGLISRFTSGKNSDITSSYINPNFEVSILKWITPVVGGRLGIMMSNGREGLEMYNPYAINHSPFPYKVERMDGYQTSYSGPGTLHYGSMLAHADIMWGMLNTIKGYEPDRFYNVCLYASGCLLYMYDNKTENKGLNSKNHDLELCFGAGIYNTFRISERVLITADLRFLTHASRYRTLSAINTYVPSVNIGVAYNFFRTKWEQVKISGCQATTIVEAMEAEKLLREENEALKKEIEGLRPEFKDSVKDTSNNPD